MRMVRRSRVLRVLILVLAVLLVVAACGDDDSSDVDLDAGLDVGDPAPAFTLEASDGSTVSLSDYDGPALLYFHMADG